MRPGTCTMLSAAMTQAQCLAAPWLVARTWAPAVTSLSALATASCHAALPHDAASSIQGTALATHAACMHASHTQPCMHGCKLPDQQQHQGAGPGNRDVQLHSYPGQAAAGWQLPHRRAGLRMVSPWHPPTLSPAVQWGGGPAAARQLIHSSARLCEQKSVENLSAADRDESEAEEGIDCSHSGLHLNTKTEAAMRALEDLQRQATKDAVEQEAAREMMADPMARIMASQGMPLGFKLKAITNNAQVSSRQHDTDEGSSLRQPPPDEPNYKMEALDELFGMQAASGSSRNSRQGSSWASVAGSGAAAGGQGHGSDDAGEESGSRSEESEGGLAQDDHWGTTRESSAEIARRLVESNAELERMAAELEAANAEEEVQEVEDPSQEPLDEALPAPGEEKFKTLEQMSADIKGLDEVFEVLAQVPWLDEDDVQQKELKGVAMVGLLGTLEEVGFNIRDQVQRIWAGEHDDGMILECSAAKDQAALISILFHTQKIKDEFGPPAAYLPAAASAGSHQAAQTQALSASVVEQLVGAVRHKEDSSKQ